MSVTFTFVAVDGQDQVFGIRCMCRDKASCSCEDFDFYGICDHTEALIDCEHKALDRNVTNSNASRLLALLGFDPTELIGTVDPVIIRGRAQAALTTCVTDDLGRLQDLVALADEAARRRLLVGWA